MFWTSRPMTPISSAWGARSKRSARGFRCIRDGGLSLMKCPFCGSDNTQVVDTRANLEANTIRRRRKCVKSEKRFTTYERVDLKMPRLVKKDGSRTDFDRDKLMGSMMLALRKRPVATGEVEEAADRI